MRDLAHVLLYTVDNDPEARLILMLALSARITTIRSSQPHGASLDNERGVLELAHAARKTEIWTVELPGVATENLLRRNGFQVFPIDHHTYGTLDRVHDPITGEQLKSSLEQFLVRAEITTDDLIAWNFNPLLVRGIGVMDDRYVRGLRNEGFAPDEIRSVLAYREELDRQLNKDFDVVFQAAKLAWIQQRVVENFIVCESNTDFKVSCAISTLSISYAAEEKPIIISDRGGRQIYVNNIESDLVQQLNNCFGGHRTFTYAHGHCWGIDNDGVNLPRVRLDDVLTVLIRE